MQSPSPKKVKKKETIWWKINLKIPWSVVGSSLVIYDSLEMTDTIFWWFWTNIITEHRISTEISLFNDLASLGQVSIFVSRNPSYYPLFYFISTFHRHSFGFTHNQETNSYKTGCLRHQWFDITKKWIILTARLATDGIRMTFILMLPIQEEKRIRKCNATIPYHWNKNDIYDSTLSTTTYFRHQVEL